MSQNTLLIVPNNTVTVQNETYQVNEFPDISLIHLLEIIREGTGSEFLKKSKACAEIKELIVPSLPNSIIYENQNSKYICTLNAENFGKLIADLVIIYYQRKYDGLSKLKNITDAQKEDQADALSMIAALGGLDQENLENLEALKTSNELETNTEVKIPNISDSSTNPDKRTLSTVEVAEYEAWWKDKEKNAKQNIPPSSTEDTNRK